MEDVHCFIVDMGLIDILSIKSKRSIQRANLPYPFDSLQLLLYSRLFSRDKKNKIQISFLCTRIGITMLRAERSSSPPKSYIKHHIQFLIFRQSSRHLGMQTTLFQRPYNIQNVLDDVVCTLKRRCLRTGK